MLHLLPPSLPDKPTAKITTTDNGPASPQATNIDHTADIGIHVRASTPGQAIASAAEAMFAIMVDGISLAHRWPVQMEASGSVPVSSFP